MLCFSVGWRQNSYRKQRTHDTQTQQASAHLSDGAVVDLLSVAETSQEESHAKNEKQIGQDGAKERSLYNADLILDQSDDKDDQFDCISKSDVDQSSDGVTKATGNTLRGMAEQSSQGNDSHCIHREDYGWVETRGLAGDTHRYED